MRSIHLKQLSSVLFYFILVLFLASCSNKPGKSGSDSSVDLPDSHKPLSSDLLRLDDEGESNTQAEAIWFTASNFSTASILGRLDLKTGEIRSDFFSPSQDSIVLPAGKDKLFLLSRMGADQIAILSGASATVTYNRPLQKFSNPQFAAQDSKGKVWVVSHDLNTVDVYSSDLSVLETQIDLSDFAVPGLTTDYASLAQLQLLENHKIAVTAQRLHRGSSIWNPDKKSGLAIIDTDSFKVEYSELIKVSNPVRTYYSDSQLFILGSGDQSPNNSVSSASLGEFDVTQSQFKRISKHPFIVLDAHIYSAKKPAAMIAWYKEQDKTCAQIGEKEIYCEEGGYVFNKVLRVGNHLYLSRSDQGTSQLWILSIEDGTYKKVTTQLPIQSMAFGP
jgi:hypothetical protein